MHIETVRPGRRKGLDQPMRILHHQMHVKGQRRQRTQPGNYRRTKAQIRHKHAVHHIKMHQIGARILNKGHLPVQMGEITSQYGWRNLHGSPLSV